MKKSGTMDVRQDAEKSHVQISDLPLEIVDLREHAVPGSTDGEGLIASSSRRGAVALLSEVKRPLSKYRHFGIGHDGEDEEEMVAHPARTTRGHNDPISEPKTPKQHSPTLPPSRTPAQRSNMSHRFKLPSVNEIDGLALPTDASLQSEVSEPTGL